jgi:hypothetical protein
MSLSFARAFYFILAANEGETMKRATLHLTDNILLTSVPLVPSVLCNEESKGRENDRLKFQKKYAKSKSFRLLQSASSDDGAKPRKLK